MSLPSGEAQLAGCLKVLAGWLVGVGPKHPVIMRKALFKTLSMRRVCALRYQTGAQYSAVEYTKDRAAVGGVLAPALHPEQQVASEA